MVGKSSLEKRLKGAGKTRIRRHSVADLAFSVCEFTSVYALLSSELVDERGFSNTCRPFN
ncbi:hypothetical protein D3C85_1661240 [compost metagenome]